MGFTPRGQGKVIGRSPGPSTKAANSWRPVEPTGLQFFNDRYRMTGTMTMDICQASVVRLR